MKAVHLFRHGEANSKDEDPVRSLVFQARQAGFDSHRLPFRKSCGISLGLEKCVANCCAAL